MTDESISEASNEVSDLVRYADGDFMYGVTVNGVNVCFGKRDRFDPEYIKVKGDLIRTRYREFVSFKFDELNDPYHSTFWNANVLWNPMSKDVDANFKQAKYFAQLYLNLSK